MVENIVAGALFDFLGFLTTLQEPITLGSAHDVSRAVTLIEEWAASRGLNLKYADVRGWQKEIDS